MTMVNTVRQRLAAIEPERSIYDVMPLEQRIGNEYSADRLRTAVTALFAGAALLLVSLGMYGTLSYVVSLRRREIGLRVAFGAARSAITSHFLLKALRVVGVACLAGLALALRRVARPIEHALRRLADRSRDADALSSSSCCSSQRRRRSSRPCAPRASTR